MNPIDPELLRTFLAFAEGGSLARAAMAVNRSPSAVTAQMQRLEALIGERLLAPAGRGRVLTPVGEELAAHARRILDAHRDAWLSLRGARADGRISLGSTQRGNEPQPVGLTRGCLEQHRRYHPDGTISRHWHRARSCPSRLAIPAAGGIQPASARPGG